MKLTALMENASIRPDCCAEHGLSVLIETERHTVLFDAGASENFARNAEALGVDLRRVEAAVLSHGHNDHSGGMIEFFRLNPTAPLYVRDSFDLKHFNRKGKDISIAPELSASPRIVRVSTERLELNEQMTIVHWGGQPGVRAIDTCGMTAETAPGSALTPEQFDHEQYLLVAEGEKRVLLTGCSHRGILNIMHWARSEGVQTVIGGFHFKDVPEAEYESRLGDAAAELKKYPVTYSSCHCTGDAPFAYLKERLGGQLQSFHAGQTIVL